MSSVLSSSTQVAEGRQRKMVLEKKQPVFAFIRYQEATESVLIDLSAPPKPQLQQGARKKRLHKTFLSKA